MIKFLLSFVLLTSIVWGQETVTPWIGVAIGEDPAGVLVKEALKGTPAEQAGLKGGDVVMAIDGQKVTSPAEMISLVRTKGVGHKVEITIKVKSGKIEKRSLKLVAKPDLMDLAKANLMDKKSPEIKLTHASDSKKTFKLSEQKKVTIVEFWATWCGACAAAWPVIDDFAKKHKNIQVVAISSDEKIQLRKYLHMAKEKKVLSDAILVLSDEKKETAGSFFVPALPMFFVMDKNQTIKHIGIGTGEELDLVFQKALALTK